MENRRKEPSDNHPFIIAVAVTALVAIATGTPYFYPIPEKNIALITQAQTTLYNGWMIVLTWYFGSSKNQSKAQDTMNIQAQTAARVAENTSPSKSPGQVELQPGDHVDVAAATGDTP